MKTKILILFCSVILFASCSQYQRVLNGDDTSRKYAMADSLYNAGKYKKSLQLMEQIVPAYRGKAQAQRLMFIYANSFYLLEDYYLAGYQFERFEQTYPTSDSVEVAAYRSARSFYELSPRYSLDQKDTYTGLEKLQKFINKYPESEKRIEANALVKELREKLEKKDIEIANQHLRTAQTFGSYKPAIESYDNFITDHPGSIYRKDAFFGRFNAAYQQAINSLPSLVNQRLLSAKEFYNSFNKYYSDSDLKDEADAILQDINNRLEVSEPTS
ncbi:outer membrane protein assembly factor BamD [Jejudonia soesokkakensis]|uniref:Outer membrane protein assembly factor BamD n=1 Tax=Jejudonia soesokkakensis TaxID=1323432 RepID=A0ABW2MXT4_9FLAO